MPITRYVACISNFASKSSLQWDKFLYGGVFFFLLLVLKPSPFSHSNHIDDPEGFLVTLTIGLTKKERFIKGISMDFSKSVALCCISQSQCCFVY